MPVLVPIFGVDWRVLEVDATGTPISLANPLPVTSVAGTGGGAISVANSTATPLGGAATFTGTGEDVSGYGLIEVSLISDQASASSGLKLEFSSDNAHWDVIAFDPGIDYLIGSANHGVSYDVVPPARYFRVVYVNGAVAQGSFRLQTVYKTSGIPHALTILDATTGQFQFVRTANSLPNPFAGGTQPALLPALQNAAGTFDFLHNHQDVVVQVSTSTAAGTINTDYVVFNATCLVAHANVTSYGAAGSFLMKFQLEDANNTFVDIPGATTGVLLTGADLLLVLGAHPWPADTATAFYANYPVPRRVRLVQTVGVNNISYSAALMAGGL